MKIIKTWINKTVEHNKEVTRIKKWLKGYGIEHFKINSNLTVDVFQNVDLSMYTIEQFPLQFGKVHGSFDCSKVGLKSLKGSPHEVVGYFDCRRNYLTSLEGGPKKVGDSFICHDNKLISLKHSPEEVGNGYYCHNNKLESLEYFSPKIVNYFNCSHNRLKSLEHGPEIVRKTYDCDHNQLISLEFGPREVGETFDCSRNNLKSLENSPVKVGTFNCHDNPIYNLDNLIPATEVVNHFRFTGAFLDDESLIYNIELIAESSYSRSLTGKNLAILREKLTLPQKLEEELANANVVSKKRVKV